MGKVVLARSKWKARLEKKRMKEMKMKKKALADSEFKKKMKELEEKKKEQEKERKEHEERREEEKQRSFRQFVYIVKCEAYYWRRVWESDGFDVDGMNLPTPQRMVATKCENPDDCPLIMRLYAKMGLHRYNMIQGTNLQLSCVERYNREGSFRLRPASYYITLRALDPATGDLVPFQASSHERTRDKLYVRFYVARPQYTGTVGKLWDDKTAPEFDNISVPKWPESDDQKQFYMVQESEWEENDWIRLYLELGFVTTNRRVPNPKLSGLKIVEVMVESSNDHQQPLKGFRDATVYIKYLHGLGRGRVCKRRAIIRRCVDLRTERMCLVGDDYLSDSDHEASSKT